MTKDFTTKTDITSLNDVLMRITVDERNRSMTLIRDGSKIQLIPERISDSDLIYRNIRKLDFDSEISEFVAGQKKTGLYDLAKRIHKEIEFADSYPISDDLDFEYDEGPYIEDLDHEHGFDLTAAISPNEVFLGLDDLLEAISEEEHKSRKWATEISHADLSLYGKMRFADDEINVFSDDYVFIRKRRDVLRELISMAYEWGYLKKLDDLFEYDPAVYLKRLIHND